VPPRRLGPRRAGPPLRGTRESLESRTAAAGPPASLRYAICMTLMQLRNEDARIAYLATVYHLGRPGSEVNRDAPQKHDLGLRHVHDEVLPRLNQAVVEFDLSPYQLVRLGEALLGVTNELKQFGIAEGRSAVPRFVDAMHFLYPESAEEPGVALDIVAHAVMLHRRLGPAIAGAQQAVARASAGSATPADGNAARRPWWRFRSRRS